MNALTKRRYIDFAITTAAIATVNLIGMFGSKLLVLACVMPIMVAFAFWNFYDGDTRRDL